MRDLRSADVPERAIRAVRDGIEETEAVRAVRAWLPTPDSFLVLVGPPGTGKTVAAAVAINEIPPERTAEGYVDNELVAISRARTVLFIDAPRLAQSSSYDTDLWARLRRVHLLVVDDTGRELHDKNGWALGNLVSLLCARHDDAKRTIVTSNLSPDAWVKRYAAHDGGRLLDRLKEQERQHGRSPFYAVAGQSLRGRGPRAA